MVQIHSSAIVDQGAQVGKGTKIWHWTHISSGAEIGRDCVIGQNIYVGNGARIGNNCKIQNNVSVYDGVELENGVFVGPSVVFTNVVNPRAEVEKKSEFKKTIVKMGATIGANATIVCGVTLGEYCFVAAGSVVTRDVAPYTLVQGNPATEQGTVNADLTEIRRR